MSAIIAIDIGGTQLRVAVYPHNSIVPIKIQRAPSHGTEEGVFDRLTSLIDSVWPAEPVDIICAAVPGPLNPYTGIILETPNIPAWKNYPLAELLTKKYSVPTFIGNDANLAALGEWLYGAGKGHHDIVYLTISTGIGGGVISSDKLIEGFRGMATELGHITVLPNGPVCSCGVRGHLEAVASGTAIAKYVSEQIIAGRKSSLGFGVLTARQISEAAQQGDALAKEAFIRAGEFIGQATADFLHLFNPSIVIFGGGVSFSGDLLFGPVKDSLRRNIMDESYLEGLEITTAKLADDAGLLGSLAQAHIKLAEH
ncbi:MAG: ROK family protein [Anaerolineales bacterium]|jgi:glucokinase